MEILLLPFDGSKTKRTPESEVEIPDKPTEKVLTLIEQLAILNGHTSLYWTARAVAQSKRAGRILVACAPSDRDDLQPGLPHDARFKFCDLEVEDPFEKDKNRPVAAAAREYL